MLYILCKNLFYYLSLFLRHALCLNTFLELVAADFNSNFFYLRYLLFVSVSLL